LQSPVNAYIFQAMHRIEQAAASSLPASFLLGGLLLRP
jgi:hypothetical protein